MKSLICVQLFATPWTVAYQAPLSMGFSRQEYWNRLPFPFLGDLPIQGSNLGLLHCRQMLYPLSHQGRRVCVYTHIYMCVCLCMYIYNIYYIYCICVCGNRYFHKTIHFKLSNRDILCLTLFYLEKNVCVCVLKMHFNASLC